MRESFDFVVKVPLWPAGHLPHKGGEYLPHTPASIEPPQIGWIKPSPLWGGWGGDFFPHAMRLRLLANVAGRPEGDFFNV